MKNVFVFASTLAMGYQCNAGELHIEAGGTKSITATKGSTLEDGIHKNVPMLLSLREIRLKLSVAA